MTDKDPLHSQRELVAALYRPDIYPHPVRSIEVIETHISWVVLAGDYAYKLKKSIDLGFLDFTSLEKRRHCCAEEVRLNRRTAPEIYIDVVSITGSAQEPQFAGAGSIIEVAVRMHRFARDEELDVLIAGARLASADMHELAASVATFHAAAERSRDREFGAPAMVLEQALQNFTQIAPLILEPARQVRLNQLRAWTESEHARIAPLLAERLRQGFVRECHGDLHLANMVRHAGRIVAFDCIEFNPQLRWIDVINDFAFTLMDLRHRDRPDLARVALNAYLEHSGDYQALALLPFFLVYRALVRAKVAAIRACQAGVTLTDRHLSLADCDAYLDLASDATRHGRPLLIVTHGLSGSGKSHASTDLIEVRDWVRLRSDVERKRLAGLRPLDASTPADKQSLYSAVATTRVYAHLEEMAASLLATGTSVMVDAAFLERRLRDDFRALAVRLGAGFAILATHADHPELVRRIKARARAGIDASEATVEVLEWQMRIQQPVGAEEQQFAVYLDTGLRFDAAVIAGSLEAVAGMAQATAIG